jgi:hypothetical protein
MITVPERDIAAMLTRDRSGNAQAKTDAGLGRIARRLAPIERRETFSFRDNQLPAMDLSRMPHRSK